MPRLFALLLSLLAGILNAKEAVDSCDGPLSAMLVGPKFGYLYAPKIADNDISALHSAFIGGEASFVAEDKNNANILYGFALSLDYSSSFFRFRLGPEIIITEYIKVPVGIETGLQIMNTDSDEAVPSLYLTGFVPLLFFIPYGSFAYSGATKYQVEGGSLLKFPVAVANGPCPPSVGN